MKSILIFGGSGRIGKVVCRQLRSDTSVVYSADLEDLPTTQHRDVFIKCDIKNAYSVDKTFKTANEKHGQINTVVNCAYVKHPRYGKADVLKVLPEDFSTFVNNNLTTNYQLVRACVDYGVENIILLSSMYGEKVPEFWIYDGTNILETPLEYACSKAALNQMVRYLAKYFIYNNMDIRINAVAPGGIPSKEMDNQFRQNYEGVAPFTLDTNVAIAVHAIIENTSINGQIITVDGGFSV